MNGWDWALVFVVAVMGTAVAYLKNPEHKAFMVMLPIPFTMAVMAVGRPVDATNVIGMCSMFGYTFLVWYFRMRWKVPILLSILFAVTFYCAIGVLVARWQPTSDKAFWSLQAAAVVLGCLCAWKLPYREEPHYRTPLPVWIKFPAIMLVIIGVCLIKRYIGGFVASFPMVGLVASYEARHSLWTNVRRIPWVLITTAPMLVTLRLTQGRLGELPALCVSWPIFLAGLYIWHIQYSKRQYGQEDAKDVDPRDTAPEPMAAGTRS